MITGGRISTSLLCFRGAGGGDYPRKELYLCRNLSVATSQNSDLLNTDLFSLFLIANCYLLAQGAEKA